MIGVKHQFLIAFVLIGILGVWLAYWDISDFLTTGINTGVWNTEIIMNGLPSIIVGIIIIIADIKLFGVKVL